MNPEKNDVEIQPLFKWSKEFEILDIENNPVASIFMRLVGDADLNRAKVFALRRGAEKRKSLRTPDSDERLAYIQDLGTIEKERLVALCSLFVSKDFAREAVRNVNVPHPKELKANATLEQQENHQLEIDAYPEKLDKALREYIEKRVSSLTQQYLSMSLEELHNLYIEFAIDELSEKEMLSSFKAMCVFLGTYKDKGLKERFFESFSDLDNLDAEMKEQLISAYESLELPPEELKKLRVAMR